MFCSFLDTGSSTVTTQTAFSDICNKASYDQPYYHHVALKSGWYAFVCFVALRPKSTAMVMAGRSVHLTTLFLDKLELAVNQYFVHILSLVTDNKVSKGAKIRNRYNQVPHLTQDTNGKVTNSQ